MTRWLAVLGAIALAVILGMFAGYVRWGRQAEKVEAVEGRLQTLSSEAAMLRSQKQDLEQRLEQVGKEQERLAHENEVLQQQRTTDALVTGQGGELPVQPPK
jgi:uncharacterized protein HemX